LNFLRRRWVEDVGVGVCSFALKNKGGMILQFFEHQGIKLFHVGLLDLVADKFQSSSQRFPQFGATGLLD
jgi:hypothetical protein